MSIFGLMPTGMLKETAAGFYIDKGIMIYGFFKFVFCAVFSSVKSVFILLYAEHKSKEYRDARVFPDLLFLGRTKISSPPGGNGVHCVEIRPVD